MAGREYYDAFEGDYYKNAEHSDVPAQRVWVRRRYSACLEAAKRFFRKRALVLDIGCGSGAFAEKLGAANVRVVGVDVSRTQIAYAKRNVGGAFVLADAGRLPFKTGVADGVTCLEVIEHFEDPLSVLGEQQRVLKPTGCAVLSTPNRNSLFSVFWSLWKSWKGSVWKEEGAHAWYFSRGLMKLAADIAGFAVEKIETIIFLAPALSFVGVDAPRLERYAERLGFGSLLVCVLRKPGE